MILSVLDACLDAKDAARRFAPRGATLLPVDPSCLTNVTLPRDPDYESPNLLSLLRSS